MEIIIVGRDNYKEVGLTLEEAFSYYYLILPDGVTAVTDELKEVLTLELARADGDCLGIYADHEGGRISLWEGVHNNPYALSYLLVDGICLREFLFVFELFPESFVDIFRRYPLLFGSFKRADTLLGRFRQIVPAAIQCPLVTADVVEIASLCRKCQIRFGLLKEEVVAAKVVLKEEDFTAFFPLVHKCCGAN